MNVLINIFTFLLILISIFLILVVLLQRAKSDGAVAAMGGGGMESTFGAETGNVLVSATKYATIAFFTLSFVLYLAHIHQARTAKATDDSALPVVTAPAVPAPATQPDAAPGGSTQPANPPPGDAPKP